MSASPRGGRSPEPMRPGEYDGATDAVSEATPMFASPNELSRSYQTTQLTTHREARNESQEGHDDDDDDEHERHDDPSNYGEGLTVGSPPVSGRKASTQSIRSSNTARKTRMSNSMRRTSDRGSIRTGGRRDSRSGARSARGGGGGGEESEEQDGESSQSVGGRGRQRGKARRVRKWWNVVVDKYGSVELDNKGSVARDHLALERTYLAWLRTSLSFASIGIAITQLFRLNTTISNREGLVPDPAENGVVRLRQMGKPLGATFLAIAIVVLLVGSRRYFESQHWIIKGKFPASRGSVFLITIVSVALIIVSLVVVLVVNPTLLKA